MLFDSYVHGIRTDDSAESEGFGSNRRKPSGEDKLTFDDAVQRKENVSHLVKREFIPAYAKVFLLDSEMNYKR